MTRSTLDPARRCFLGRGFCEITRPSWASEYRCPILPVRQCASRSRCRAVSSDLPLSLGTMQAIVGWNTALADRARFIVRLQLFRAVEQAPDQRLKTDPLAGLATRVTPVP